ncbi:MAG: LysR substrate-binding domain-containing protein [Clostridium fessum]
MTASATSVWSELLPRTPPANFSPFASDELVIAAPATPHYQAYQTMPSPLDALLKEPFLLREDNSGTKQETLHFLKNKGLSLDDLNVIAVMDDAAALKQCIMLGMGISILSKATVQADARQGKPLSSAWGSRLSPETLSGVFAG